MLKPILSIIALVGTLTTAAPSGAAVANETEIALQQLERMRTDLETIEHDVERHKLGNLVNYQKQVKLIVDSIGELGWSHEVTTTKAKTLNRKLLSSSAYFNSIATPFTQPYIDDVLAIRGAIAKARGFNEVPYSLNTLDTFTEIQVAIADLQKLPISPRLASAIQALIPDLAFVVSESKRGDRPRTFAPAIEFVRDFRKLYPLFFEISSNDRAFEAFLNIQGLIEIYAEYADVDR